MTEVLAIDRTLIEGVAAVIAALVLFCGSVFLLLAAVFGPRMGYLVAATAFFGFMLILSALWVFGAPGTPRFLGPKGELPHWVAVGAGTDLESPTFPVISDYPGGRWEESGEEETAEVEPVTLAFQEFLAEEATGELRRRGVEGNVSPEDFEIKDIRFARSGETQLAAATAFAATGGRQVTVLGLRDEGDEPVPSFIALGIAVIGFAIHIPLLDRAERRRKEILTGGDQAAWRGPA
ncbi:MAG: hypothetical protein ACRDI0_10905 [Actinomycetota bacterium]